MRACLLDAQAPIETRPLRVGHRETPEPRPGEVLVEVTACGICRTDLHVIEGDLPAKRTPLVPGHQIVGRIAAHGPGVAGPAVGTRVGVAWLHRTCGTCRFCLSGRENLCLDPAFTGWTVDGGFAEFVRAPAAFVHCLPVGLDDVAAAPLLCAGIIGHRALRLTGLAERPGGWPGARLGIYGFGAAGHLAIQLARHRGTEVFVATRDRAKHQTLAQELGAVWVGDTFDVPPEPLDAAIVFAPAGEVVPAALAALDRGGSLVLGGIHMSPTPPLAYERLWHERVVRSVANNTREDARTFLAEAVEARLHTHTQRYRFDQANDALIALKRDAIKGAAVLAGWA